MFSSEVDSSTRTQARQLDQDQQTFARLVATVRKTGEIPTDEQIDQAGTLAEDLRELCVDLQDTGLAQFNTNLQVMSRTNRRIMAALSWLENQEAKQKEKDARLTIGKRGVTVFKTLSISDLKTLPPAKWILPQIWQKVATSLMYGDANTGKTFVALDLAMHFACGLDWQGRALPRLRVLYIFGEGDVGLAARVEAWLKYHNQADTDFVQFICFPVQLLTELDVLCATIEDQDEIPGLIVIDTFSVCAEGIDENNNAEVARFINAATYIKRTYGTHVHIIHHSGKNGDYRGAAAFRGNVDTMILLSRENSTAPIVMSCKKQKDAEHFPDIYLQLQQVELGLDPETLEPLTSCVVVAGQKSAQNGETEESDAKEREQMIDILRLHRKLSVNRWISECRSVGISKNAYYRHIKILREANRVIYQAPEKRGLSGIFMLSPSEEIESILQGSEV
jgi:hypothetical protein